MSNEATESERCLATPAGTFLSCGSELAGLDEALAPARLDADSRKAVDTGSGLPAECLRADTAARWLPACAAAARAAGASAEALPAATRIATAAEEAIAAVTSFQRAVRGGSLLFLAALGLFPQALREALGRRLAQGGLSDDDRDGIEADLAALSAPVDGDAERARDGQLRFERRKADLEAEVAPAQQGAAEGRARLETLGAVRRGEPLSPEALLTLRPAPAAPPPAPRRRTRR